MKYNGPKDRLSRREGVDLFGKGNRIKRLNLPPGMHGPKGTRKMSEYGRQLREKQKVKRMYGLSEKQFAAYVGKAQKSRGNTGEALIQLIERRLDNTVFRLGFTPTRTSARQIVSHGHILVDAKRVNIPSFLVKEGQTVALDTKAQNIPEVKKLLEVEAPEVAGWLERKAAIGLVKSYPKREQITEAISEQDIVEYYSR